MAYAALSKRCTLSLSSLVLPHSREECLGSRFSLVFFPEVSDQRTQSKVDFREHGVECSPKTRCGKGSRAGKKKKITCLIK